MWQAGRHGIGADRRIWCSEQQLLDEFGVRLRAEVAERRAELDPDSALLSDTALADIMLGYMEEAGLVTEHELCPYEDTAGRNRCRVIGSALPEDSGRLEIFTAYFWLMRAKRISALMLHGRTSRTEAV